MQNPSIHNSLCCCNCLALGGLPSALFTGNCLTRPIYFAAGFFHGAPLFFHSLLPIVDNLLASVLNRLLPNLVSRKKPSTSERSNESEKLRCRSPRHCSCPGAGARPLSQGCCVHPPAQRFGISGGHMSCLHLLGETAPSFQMRGQQARRRSAQVPGSF